MLGKTQFEHGLFLMEGPCGGDDGQRRLFFLARNFLVRRSLTGRKECVAVGPEQACAQRKGLLHKGR